MHATSTGKALIAFDDDGLERLGTALPPLTSRTIVRRSELERQLAEIRSRGFAETVDELEEGFSGVATVIRGGHGEVLGAISICGPTQRMSGARRMRLGAMLCAAARGMQGTQ
jgi:DNA-binding IclR family transcriptional regulator